MTWKPWVFCVNRGNQCIRLNWINRDVSLGREKISFSYNFFIEIYLFVVEWESLAVGLLDTLGVSWTHPSLLLILLSRLEDRWSVRNTHISVDPLRSPESNTSHHLHCSLSSPKLYHFLPALSQKHILVLLLPIFFFTIVYYPHRGQTNKSNHFFLLLKI